MRKEQFDILVALEKDRLALDTRTLAALTGMDAERVAAIVAQLTGEGLVAENAITDRGVAALDHYKTKRAVFIAAGYGSRLRPVTHTIPKPLVKVNGVRIIDTLIDGVLAAGVEEIYVVCGYLKEQFAVLKEKYPQIHLVDNPYYTTCNNISSVLLTREHLRNAYVLEADLFIHNKAIFDKYLYHSSYLGIPTEETDDWYFKTDENGVLYELGIGAKDCHRMLGISYWSAEDGATLEEHVKATFDMPGGKDEDWCYVPLVAFKDAYQVHVRECSAADIEEIDTFEELCAIDPSYRSFG